MGAGRTTSPARRTSADKRLTIIPGRGRIRTKLNATQVSTDRMAGTYQAEQAFSLQHPRQRCTWYMRRSLTRLLSCLRVGRSRAVTITLDREEICPSWLTAVTASATVAETACYRAAGALCIHKPVPKLAVGERLTLLRTRRFWRRVFWGTR